jgi:hypothetical protein
LADLVVNGEPRGSISFALGDDASPLLDARLIRDILAGIAKPELVASVANGDRLITADELGLVGIRVSFDPSTLILAVDVEPRAMISSDLSAGDDQFSAPGKFWLHPEPFAAQLGLSLTLDPVYTSSAYDSRFSPRAELGLDPAFNVLGFVAEGSAEIMYDTSLATRVDQARLLRDFPALGARLAAGIVDTRPVSFQSSDELLGLAFYSESTLPGSMASRRPLLEDFILERKADVSIAVNGVSHGAFAFSLARIGSPTCHSLRA